MAMCRWVGDRFSGAGCPAPLGIDLDSAASLLVVAERRQMAPLADRDLAVHGRVDLAVERVGAGGGEHEAVGRA